MMPPFEEEDTAVPDVAYGKDDEIVRLHEQLEAVTQQAKLNAEDAIEWMRKYTAAKQASVEAESHANRLADIVIELNRDISALRRENRQSAEALRDLAKVLAVQTAHYEAQT